MQWRSLLEAALNSLSLGTCPCRYLGGNSHRPSVDTAVASQDTSRSNSRLHVGAQLPFSVVKASNMPTLRLALFLGTPFGTLWFLRTRKMKALDFTLTFQCHCSYRSSAWSPVYCFHHYSLRAFLLRDEQTN